MHVPLGLNRISSDRRGRHCTRCLACVVSSADEDDATTADHVVSRVFGLVPDHAGDDFSFDRAFYGAYGWDYRHCSRQGKSYIISLRILGTPPRQKGGAGREDTHLMP